MTVASSHGFKSDAEEVAHVTRTASRDGDSTWSDVVSNFVEQFDSAVHDFWGAHPRPTRASLERISQALRIRLPDLLVSLARESSRFANLFLSLGDNYESHDHIIPYNRYWRQRRRTRRLPKDLVIITNGWMDDDFNCLVRPENSSDTVVAVEFWSPAPVGFPKQSHRGPRHESFETFLTGLIRHHADARRRSAK